MYQIFQLTTRKFQSMIDVTERQSSTRVLVNILNYNAYFIMISIAIKRLNVFKIEILYQIVDVGTNSYVEMRIMAAKVFLGFQMHEVRTLASHIICPTQRFSHRCRARSMYVLIFHYSIVLLLYELFICKQEQKYISFDTIAVLCLLLSKDVFPYVQMLSIVNTFGYISTY